MALGAYDTDDSVHADLVGASDLVLMLFLFHLHRPIIRRAIRLLGRGSEIVMKTSV